MAPVVAALAVLASPAAAGAGTTWLQYHGGATHSGNDTSEPALLPIHQAWTVGLDQNVYGQR